MEPPRATCKWDWSSSVLRIRGGTVVTMDDRRAVFTESSIEVGDDGKIVRVGEPSVEAAEEIDARGMIVLPGLVQTHVHLCQTLYRNRADDLDLLRWLRERIWPYEAALDERALRASARLGLAELVRNGTTTLLDMGTVHHYDQVFVAAEELGIRLVGGKCLMDAGDAVPKGLLESTRAAVDESVALSRRWHGRGSGRLRYAFAPRFVLSCTEELLKEVAELSRTSGLLVHTHASEQKAECAIVREERGLDNIEYLQELGISGPRAVLAHCVHVTEREVDLLAAEKTRVAHCPSSNLKLGSGVAPVPELLARGVHLSLGADGAPCNNLLDPWEEMRLAALIQKARLGPTSMPAREVVALATIEGARALGLEREIGSIEPGKRADLVLVDPARLHSTPFPADDVYGLLVYATRSEQVHTVLVDGRVLLRGGKLVAWDERAVRDEATEELARISVAI
jgi:cytosine/adenosine deaminase-related metal-dependent hydrolase